MSNRTIPLKLHDRHRPDLLSDRFVAHLDTCLETARQFVGRRWAEWHKDPDLIAYLESRLDPGIIAALRSYKNRRLSFADAAFICRKTIASLRGFAGMAVRFAQEYCRKAPQSPKQPLWNERQQSFLAQYD